MCISYRCTGMHNMKPQTWTGSVTFINTSEFIEADVRSRGSQFHILVGRHRYGRYLCIPRLGIGTELSNLSDRFWNLENLMNTYPKISRIDLISITDALVEISKYCQI